jgi:16S rRNA (guanine966-N2)-methyltransferase
VRLAFFSSIGDRIKNARFLDLFAGSGIMGFEAISRGAGDVVCVEINRKNSMVIKDNLTLLGIESLNLEVICMDALLFLKNMRKKFDIVYADPPYDTEGLWQKKILSIFESMPILFPSGVLVIEQSVRAPDIVGTQLTLKIETKRYGETKLLYIVQK